MSYEPGSPECRSLIEAKDNILNAIKSIKKIDNTIDIECQLLSIYKELEKLHEVRRLKEKS